MTDDETRQDLGEWVKQRRLELRLSVRGAARRAGVDRATWAGVEDGSRHTQDTKYAGIEDALEVPRGSIAARLSPPTPGPSEFDQQPPLPSVRPEDYPTPPGQEDDGWTDADEAFYQALTELLKRQGLKPTPKIIQAMRDEWEREQAELAERNESDYSG